MTKLLNGVGLPEMLYSQQEKLERRLILVMSSSTVPVPSLVLLPCPLPFGSTKRRVACLGGTY